MSKKHEKASHLRWNKNGQKCMKKIQPWDFPGGTVVKNPAANSEDTGSIPSVGRSHVA